MDYVLENRIAWAGFEMRVPEDWEINRHTLSCRRGKLVLVDRRRQRMEIVWRMAESRPDLNRLCRDLKARVRKNSIDGETPDLKAANGWSGFWLRLDEKSVLAYALRWHQDSGRIFQLTIVTRDDEQIDSSSFINQILSHFKDRGWQQKTVRWKAFGVDCTSPVGWRLVSTQAKPMNIKLQFRDCGEEDNDEGDNEITVQRLGMVDSWFNGDLQSFIRSGDMKLDFEFNQTTCCGHHAISAVAQKEASWLDRVRGRNRIQRDLAWVCEPMNSLFRVAAVHIPKKPVQPQDISVTCPKPI